MNPLYLRGLFHSKKHKSHFPPLFLRIYHFSTVSGTASYPKSPRRQEEDSRNVQISVWWDFENCNIPAGANEFKVTQTITAAIRANGMKGPIQITAFGDVFQLSKTSQEALTSTGVLINHVPRGGKNSADRSLLVDLLYWTSKNPPPAHLLLISGDRDFAGILHKLRMLNYNILLAGPNDAPAVLCSAASIMWHWYSLVKEENFNGKHYNQPPDGPNGSWYGHYKRPLEDPFAVNRQKPTLSNDKDESCLKSNTTRAIQIPKTVVRQVQCILLSHPKGISINDLVKQLNFLPKGYYGYQKITYFIAAMPHIGKLQCQGSGNYWVTPVRAIQPLKDNLGQVDAGLVESDNYGLKVEVAEKSESDAEIENKTSSESLQEPIRNDKPEDESGNRMDEEKVWRSNNPNVDADSLESLSDESKSVQQTGLFQKVVKSFKFWKTSDETKISNDQSKNIVSEQSSNSSLGNEIFSKDTFWSDMNFFLDSTKGGSVVRLSTTRASMAQNLQNKGPAALKTLGQNDLLHLVDLLIDKKKLIEENPSDVPHFKLVKPHSSKVLNDIMSDKHGTERNHCNIPYSEVSSPPVKAKDAPCRSKDQISKDCKEFVKDVLRKHPDGYDINLFWKDFKNKYGYMINPQILGHAKLSSFLETIPGVFLNSGCIVSSSSTNQISLNSDIDASLSKSDDDFESLGPVTSSSPKDGAEVHLSSASEDESCKARVAKQRQLSNKEDTSMLQILDSCYVKKNMSSRSPNTNGVGKVYRVKMTTEEVSKDKSIHEILDCMKRMGNAER